MSGATTDATALEIRTGLANALADGIPGLNVQRYVLANITPPCATIIRGPISYDEAFVGGAHTWTYIVRVYVASVTDIGAATLLDQFLAPEGERSVKAALEADTSLGGVVSDLHVTDATGEQELVRDQGGPLLFSEWTVQVWI